ncbi:MAG: hypothetical protein Q8N47_25465 [Bryobacterales bacterium]|nr:hypothetical protein [Bryobacterales bacterium]
MRIAIPRRVCSQARMDAAAYGVWRVLEQRRKIRGRRWTCAPRHPRFFQARLEPAGGDLG